MSKSLNGVTNAQIALLLRRYANVLALHDETNPFKLKAYLRAANTIETATDNIAQMVLSGKDLKQLPGVGKSISDIIREIVLQGSLASLQDKESHLSPQLLELSGKPGLDKKKVLRIYKKLSIQSLDELKQKLDEGIIREAFGDRMDFHIRHGLENNPRILLRSVQDLATKIEQYLMMLPEVTKVSLAGEVRRKQETVGSLEYLVTGKEAYSIFQKFQRFSAVLSSEKQTDNEWQYQLSSGISVRVYWTPISKWGLSLIQATGSKGHLLELQEVLKASEMSSKYLRFRDVELSSEEQVYQRIGLSYIEPELREGRGEVKAALDGTLPQLIVVDDIQGDLHMHTTASDGVDSIEEMAQMAQERGYAYIGITDHSQSLRIAGGQSEQALRDQIHSIDTLNQRLKGFRILKSAEVDILEDGRLDYPDALLKELDYTICSIHSRFNLSKQQQTERILRAMDNRYFTILGHPTGRLLLKRPGYEMDLHRIFRHAQKNRCFFEINSSPDRLDLSDIYTREVKELGIKLAINTDAHCIQELDLISSGINQARRAWLEAKDVLNTLPVHELLRCFKR